MTNIQLTAIRLIANNYLFSREKNKESHGYRFDSSFLTKRGITTVKDMEALQEELNKRGWCFNILNFNDYVIQEKSFLAEMTKLGFSRVESKSDEELIATNLLLINESVQSRITKLVCKETNIDPKRITICNPKVYDKDECAKSDIFFDGQMVELSSNENITKVSIKEVNFETTINNLQRNLKEKLGTLCYLINAKHKMDKETDEILEEIKGVLAKYSLETRVNKIFDYGNNGLTFEVDVFKRNPYDEIGRLLTLTFEAKGVWVKFNSNACVSCPSTAFKKEETTYWADYTIRELLSKKEGRCMSRETIRFANGVIVTIYYSTNETLMQQCKLKRNFSQEFKDWFIWMKANFDKGLATHGDRNDWWWVPAMRLQMPGVKIKGIDY